MKEEFRDILKKARDRMLEQERVTILLTHALNKIQTPTGLQELSIGMWVDNPVNCVVWANYWPLDAVCGIAAEIESLLETEAIFSFDENSARYKFFSGTPLMFELVSISPKGCTIKTEGGYSWPKAVSIDCGDGRKEDTNEPREEATSDNTSGGQDTKGTETDTL